MAKKPPNHAITDQVDAALNVALVLIDNPNGTGTHYYSDEVFVRELHSRGYVILPRDRATMDDVDPAIDGRPDKSGENAP